MVITPDTSWSRVRDRLGFGVKARAAARRVGWFVVFAAVQAVTLLAAGPVIDRFGPRRVLPLFLTPFALGLAALAWSDSPWIAPVDVVLAGVSSAVASTLATAVQVERYRPDQLARVRSVVEAALVVASGASRSSWES